MKRARWEQLARKSIIDAGRDRASYSRKLRFFASFGAFWPLLVSGICVLLAAYIGVKLALVINTAIVSNGEEPRMQMAVYGTVALGLCVAAFTLIRSVFVTIPVPQGFVVSREAAPDLHALVDDVAKLMDMKPPNAIILDTSLGAWAMERPRFWVFGPYRRYLGIGLVALQVLSAAELRAVIAHELTHVSLRHGRDSVHVARTLTIWDRLIALIRYSKSESFIDLVAHLVRRYALIAFGNIYGPRLEAMSFAARRNGELAADATAVKVSGGQSLATGLMRLEVREQSLQVLDTGYRTQNTLMARSPDPDVRAFQSIMSTSTQPLDPWRVATWLASALMQETDFFDEHPALVDRMKMASTPIPGAPNSASVVDWATYLAAPETQPASKLLGNQYAPIIAEVERIWKQAEINHWAVQHYSLGEALSSLNESRAKLRSQSLMAHEAFHAMELAQVVGSEQDRIAFLQFAAARDPEDPRVAFEWGNELYRRQDPAYMQWWTFAAAVDPIFGPRVNLCIQLAHTVAGNREEANLASERRKELVAQLERAAAEKVVAVKELRDNLQATQLTVRQRRLLAWSLEGVNGVLNAWVAKCGAPYTHFPEHVPIVVVVENTGKASAELILQTVLERLEPVNLVSPLASFYVVVTDASDKKYGALMAQAKSIVGSQVYPPQGGVPQVLAA